MKALKIALMVALPLAASVGTTAEDALAAGQCSTASGTCNGRVLGITIHPDGGAGSPAITGEVMIEVTSTPTTPGCTLTGGWWEIGTGKDNTIKALTAAYLAGKPVTLRQTATTGACFVAWAAF